VNAANSVFVVPFGVVAVTSLVVNLALLEIVQLALMLVAVVPVTVHDTPLLPPPDVIEIVTAVAPVRSVPFKVTATVVL
jgi:hypothetical protein